MCATSRKEGKDGKGYGPGRWGQPPVWEGQVDEGGAWRSHEVWTMHGHQVPNAFPLKQFAAVERVLADR